MGWCVRWTSVAAGPGCGGTHTEPMCSRRSRRIFCVSWNLQWATKPPCGSFHFGKAIRHQQGVGTPPARRLGLAGAALPPRARRRLAGPEQANNLSERRTTRASATVRRHAARGRMTRGSRCWRRLKGRPAGLAGWVEPSGTHRPDRKQAHGGDGLRHGGAVFRLPRDRRGRRRDLGALLRLVTAVRRRTPSHKGAPVTVA